MKQKKIESEILKMENNELLKNKDNNNLKVMSTKYRGETKLFNIDVFNKNKEVKYKGGYYKPIGFLEKDVDDFFILSNIISGTLSEQKFDYDNFYDECKKQGCKKTDLFLCVNHKNKKMIGKIVIPSNNKFFEVDIYKLNFKFD